MFRGAENVKPQKERPKTENRHKTAIKKAKKVGIKNVGINFSRQKVTKFFQILVTFYRLFYCRLFFYRLIFLPIFFIPTFLYR